MLYENDTSRSYLLLENVNNYLLNFKDIVKMGLSSKWIVFLVPLIGIILSLYAIYVEYKATISSSYEALCDISEHISCSKVFLSEYGKIFSKFGLVPKDSALDQPNAFYGMIFYIMIAFLMKFDNKMVVDLALLMATLSLVLSAYLSYILYDIIGDICFVCFSTYVCNVIIFFICAKRAFRFS